MGDGLVEGNAMSLAKSLWVENADVARAALEHRFVRGLGNGDLPLGSFQKYVAQDAFFLEAFARAYALALALAWIARGYTTSRSCWPECWRSWSCMANTPRAGA